MVASNQPATKSRMMEGTRRFRRGYLARRQAWIACHDRASSRMPARGEARRPTDIDRLDPR